MERARIDRDGAGVELPRRAAEDGSAFGELLAELRPGLVRTVERWIGGAGARTVAEDVVQEACLRAFRARGALRAADRGAFAAWLRRIARNRLHDLWRAQRRELRALGRRAELSPETELPRASPARALELLEDRMRLYAGLARLRTDERLVVLLRELLQLSWETTTLLLGRRTVKATRSLHARTCAKILRAVPAADAPPRG